MTRGTCKTIAEIFALLVKIFVIAALVVAVIGLSQARTEAQERAEEHKREISEHKANEERLTRELVAAAEKATEKEAELTTKANNLITSLQNEIEDLKAINKEQAATIKEQEQALTVLMKKEPNPYAKIKMTEEEKDLLAWVLALEAKEEPEVGQHAVVEEIFNRVLMDEWKGDTVEEILKAPGQFDGYKILQEYREGKRTKLYAYPDEKEKASIDFVLKYGRTALPEDYVYFATYKANGRDFIQISGHYFSRG